jgi:hypothetical protein
VHIVVAACGKCGGNDPRPGSGEAPERAGQAEAVEDRLLWVQDQRVLGVQPLPASPDLSLVGAGGGGDQAEVAAAGCGGDLGDGRGAAEFGEARVGQVAQGEVVLVHPCSGFLGTSPAAENIRRLEYSVVFELL